MARKRRKASSAFSTASSPSLPVVATARPSPHRTFSLKSGCRGPHGALVDDEAHGVRPDIDHAERFELRDTGSVR